MNPFEYGKSFSKRIGFGIGIIITQATKKYCTAICYIKMGEYQTKCGALCMEEPEKLTFEIENIFQKDLFHMCLLLIGFVDPIPMNESRF